MIDSVQSQLAAGNYTAAIQDALGNQGASVRISTENGKITVTQSGMPEVQVTAPSSSSSPVTDTIAFSPAAEALLSDENVALAMLNAAAARTQNAVHPAGGSTLPSPQTTSPSAGTGGAAQTVTASSSSSVADIVAAAYAASQNPNSLYEQWDNPNALEGVLSIMGSQTEKSSFLAALNSKTLTITNTSDIPGFDYSSTTILTGTGEFMGGGGYNEQALQAAQAQGGGYSLLIEEPLGGAFLVTWGPGTSAS